MLDGQKNLTYYRDESMPLPFKSQDQGGGFFTYTGILQAGYSFSSFAFLVVEEVNKAL